MNSQPASRIYAEEEAADILRRGGSTRATAKTVRWLLQQNGAPARPDFQVDLDALADYLRRVANRKARGLKAVAALFDKIVPERAKPRALTYAERQAKSRAKSSHNDIKADLDAAIEGINWKSRRRAERDLVYFLKTYCTGEPNEGAFLETPPPAEMLVIVKVFETSVGRAAIPFHIRMPRGMGKTAYTKGAAKWAMATGRRHFLVAVAANSDNAENIIEDIYAGITENPNFVRDWPEVAIPFLKLEGGVSAREDTEVPRRTDQAVEVRRQDRPADNPGSANRPAVSVVGRHSRSRRLFVRGARQGQDDPAPGLPVP